MKINLRGILTFLILAAVLPLFLSGCANEGTESSSSSLPATEMSDNIASESEDTGASIVKSPAADEKEKPTDETSGSDSELVADEQPVKEVVVKDALVASDPESAVLASGKVQLVEFFAFG